jgi:hypothetical protein
MQGIGSPRLVSAALSASRPLPPFTVGTLVLGSG